MENEEAEFTAHKLDEEEIEELMNTECVLAVVFQGKLKNLYDTTRFLRELGCHVYYRKSSKSKLEIVVHKEKGEKNGND